MQSRDLSPHSQLVPWEAAIYKGCGYVPAHFLWEAVERLLLNVLCRGSSSAVTPKPERTEPLAGLELGAAMQKGARPEGPPRADPIPGGVGGSGLEGGGGQRRFQGDFLTQPCRRTAESPRDVLEPRGCSGRSSLVTPPERGS